MTLKEFRQMTGMTQKEVLDVIKDVSPGLDLPTLSKIENGAGDLSPEAWKSILSLLQHGFPARNDDEGISYRPDEKTPLNSTFLQRVYEECCNASEDNPATKARLMRVTGRSEREVRMAIVDLRKAGVPIVSTSRTRGYWRARSDADYARLRGEYMARVKDIMETVRNMDAKRQLSGQMKIGGIQ